jgi:hypothetical protein
MFFVSFVSSPSVPRAFGEVQVEEGSHRHVAPLDASRLKIELIASNVNLRWRLRRQCFGILHQGHPIPYPTSFWWDLHLTTAI